MKIKNILNKFFSSFTVATVVVLSLIPLINSATPVSANPCTQDYQNTRDGALCNNEALGGLFSSCRYYEGTTGVKDTEAAGTISPDTEKPANVLITCLRSVLVIIFVITVIVIVVRVAGNNAGIIGRGGDGGDSVKFARDQIQNGLIGLLIIGGAIMLLSLFNGGLANLNLIVPDSIRGGTTASSYTFIYKTTGATPKTVNVVSTDDCQKIIDVATSKKYTLDECSKAHSCITNATAQALDSKKDDALNQCLTRYGNSIITIG